MIATINLRRAADAVAAEIDAAASQVGCAQVVGHDRHLIDKLRTAQAH